MKRFLCAFLALTLLLVIAAMGFGWWQQYRPVTLDAETTQTILLQYADEIDLIEEKYGITIDSFRSDSLEPFTSMAIEMYKVPGYDFSGLVDTLGLAFLAARRQ